jgi:CBS domain-containing protein
MTTSNNASRSVRDVMSQPVVVAAPGDAVAVVAGRMYEGRVGSVVIVAGTRPVGILTERDLLRSRNG